MKHEDIDKLRDRLHAIEEAVGWMGDYRAALDELAALRDRTTWRPIETFDLQDDDSALLAIDGSPYMGARCRGEFWIDGNYLDSFHPTHWLPLPEAPR